jgi:hypothetical protein
MTVILKIGIENGTKNECRIQGETIQGKHVMSRSPVSAVH